MSDDIICFDHVCKAFNGVRVLDDLSFSVRRGEVLCVTGPSGTGKSVTLKHIVNLLSPDSGRVLIDGIDVADCSGHELRAIRDRVGYLFQGGALLAWMTVEENVALPLRERTKLKESEIAARVAEALAEVELSESAYKYPDELSGGMQKRAGLARAIVRQSDIVLYDEPTSGLDPVTSVTINHLIRRLNRERGITSIVVTHDLAGAFSIADRMLLLKGGRVLELATPQEFSRSENPVVKDFLAAMKGEVSK